MKGIALIGFMGSGKSTIGRAVARSLTWDFVDLDESIARESGMSVGEIFRREGEAGFRRRESNVLLSLTGTQSLVLACGGGIVLLDANRRFLADHFHVVYLDVTLSEIKRRLAAEHIDRPLLVGDDPEARITELYQARRQLYLEVADTVIPVGGESVMDTVNLVLGATKEVTANR